MPTVDELLRAARLEKRAIAKRQLPLAAYYGRGDAFEARRNEFYENMARKMGWPQRSLVPTTLARETTLGAAGRNGRPATVELVGKRRSVPVITNSAPLEFLLHERKLARAGDGQQAAMIRFEAGMRLRGLMEGAEVSAMKSASLEGGGGGSFSGRTVSDHKIDCMNKLTNVRSRIPAQIMKLIEDVVFHDRWTWDLAQDPARVITQVQYGLDQVAAALGMADAGAVNSRWKAVRTSLERAQEKP